MPFTPEQQRASLASFSHMVKLQTLQFENPNMETLRLVSDRQDLQDEDGRVFNRFDFEAVPPEKTTETTPQLKISIGIVDHRVMQALRELRGIRGKIRITYTEVEADDPSQIIYGPAVFYYHSLSTNGNTAATINAVFLKGALDNDYPAPRVSPSNARAN